MSLVPFLPNWAAAITVGTVMLLYPRVYVANRYLWNIVRGRDKDDVSALRAWFERLSGVALVAYGGVPAGGSADVAAVGVGTRAVMTCARPRASPSCIIRPPGSTHHQTFYYFRHNRLRCQR